MSQATEYIVRVHRDDDGSFWAHVLDLPGCFASGDSLDELWEALQEAIPLYLADDSSVDTGSGVDRPVSVDRPMRVGEMRVLLAG